MEIPAGSQEDQRHKHFFYLQLYFYLQPGFFSLEKLPFSFGRPLPLLSASLTWLFLWCTRKVAYFPTFAFPPSFDFEKIARQRELQIGDVSLPNLVLVSKLNQMPECWSTTKSSWCKNVKSRIGSNISGRWWLAIVLSGVVAALFVCFLICFCHEGGRRVRPVGGLEAASCPGLSAESPLCPASVWTCLSGCPCPTRRCPAGVAVSDGLSEFLSKHQLPKNPKQKLLPPLSVLLRTQWWTFKKIDILGVGDLYESTFSQCIFAWVSVKIKQSKYSHLPKYECRLPMEPTSVKFVKHPSFCQKRNLFLLVVTIFHKYFIIHTRAVQTEQF